jgi:PAS domain S-box-containing protein
MPPDDDTRERHLRAAVESSPSGLLMVDPDGTIVLVNREIERLFGYAREELLGRSVDILLPEEMRGGHGAFRGSFLKDPKVRSMGAGRDLYGLRKDGRKVPLEIGLTPVPTERGMFVLSAVVDISERRRAEAHFRVAVEASPAGVVMVDRNGRIVLVNQEVERLFGYGREELIGQPIELLVPRKFRKGHPRSREAFAKEPSTRVMGAGRELFGLRKDGTEVPVEIGLNPIETEDGLFVLSSIVDISERKREEEARRRLERHLRQAQKMEAVGTLAGGIAHDFNNILGGIQGYAELVREEVEDPRLQADLDELLTFVQRGKTLVQRIRAFGHRPESQKVPISLAGPVQEVARFLRSSVSPRIRIHTTVEEDLPRVVADASAMHQVLMNLAMNAAHAMRDGGDVSIEITSVYLTDSEARRHPELREGTHVVITVRDTGTGIPDAVKDRVFEPFFTTKAPGHGSGLGLAIVHGIVLEHAGAVELESAPGKGTSVRVKLPAVELPEAGPGPSVETPRGRGERILYVEDEPGLASLGERRLTGIGYEVVIAGDGEEALQILSEDPDAIDAIVTDHLMPLMNGTQLASEASRLRPGIPILLLTGYVENLPEDEIMARGVDRILAKPATVEELATTLRAILDER